MIITLYRYACVYAHVTKFLIILSLEGTKEPKNKAVFNTNHSLHRDATG